MKTRFGKWWYNLSVRTGICIFGPLMIAVSITKPLISSLTNDGETMFAVIDGIMLMLLVFSSVVVGALLDIDFKNHEDEKHENKTKSWK